MAVTKSVKYPHKARWRAVIQVNLYRPRYTIGSGQPPRVGEAWNIRVANGTKALMAARGKEGRRVTGGQRTNTGDPNGWAKAQLRAISREVKCL